MADFSANANRLMCMRYLYHGDSYEKCSECAQRHETYDQFFERVSLGNAEYRDVLLEPLVFLPNSPTLFNVGIEGAGTLSACFKFDVADTLLDGPDSIMATATKAAAVTKWGGGVGYYLGDIRSRGSYIATTHGAAMGPVEVMKHFHSVGNMITQAGKRNAAQMAVLPVDHPDIIEFITAKDVDPQSLSTFNISVSIPDRFMRAVVGDHDGPEARLLRMMAESAWRTGDPGVYFSSAAERHNPTPHLGMLTGVNPCGEVPLLNNEPCNLGSINVARFVDGGDFDWNRLGSVVSLAVAYLDDVIDRNTFPVDAITQANNATRKIGLGVCGWADALALLGISYNSEEAVTLANRLMSFINSVADTASLMRGYQLGSAPAMANHRNATRTCIAPTGTIAILMDASSGIEPHFALSWDRTLGNGEHITEKVSVMDRLDWFVPPTSHEIDWMWHVRHQAAFQRNTDLAVSKTINMAHDATVDDIYSAYVYMWEQGCKGGTIFRDGSRDEQVLNQQVCEDCGAPVKHENGCVACSADCGWELCSV